jgi:hypothetical protein
MGRMPPNWPALRLRGGAMSDTIIPGAPALSELLLKSNDLPQ